MEWTQVFVILGVFLGAFLWLASKIDGVRKDLSKEIQDVKKDLNSLDKRFTRVEDRLEFSNKIVYIQHEEKKEESK
jgi:hypothetical protein